MDKTVITAMSEEYARQISQWKYEGIYSFYSHNESNIDSLLDDAHFSCVNVSKKLIGYFCFGEEARIPTIEENVYGDDFLDIGLGLRPDLCGKGLGLPFLRRGMEFARDYFHTDKFRLSVAAFNERAVRVYKKAGFNVEGEITNSYFKNKFLVMKCMR